MILRINGIDIKEPKDFEVSYFNLTKSGRLASGKMVIDIIAEKRKFPFKYEIISGPKLKIITDIIRFNPFFTLEYEDDGVLQSAIVYSGAITKTKARTGNVWYWKNVSFDFIEQ